MFHSLLPRFPAKLFAALAAAITLVTSAVGARADNHISSTGAAIVGGVAGLAIGAAIADSARPHVYYPPRYQPYPQPYPYAQPYPQPYAYPQPYPYAQPYPAYYPRPVYRPAPFSPAPGVTCYPGRGLCFNGNGTVANRWSARVFGN